jgi:hypothetical protein
MGQGGVEEWQRQQEPGVSPVVGMCWERGGGVLQGGQHCRLTGGFLIYKAAKVGAGGGGGGPPHHCAAPPPPPHTHTHILCC